MGLAIIEYSFLASIVLLIGAGFGSFFRMRENSISLVQHFTAGVVFAVVSIELFPKILEARSKLHITIGFCLGVAFMLLIKTWTNQLEASKEEGQAFPFGLLAGIGIDLLIDGLLIAISFLSGEDTGRLMTFALVLEVLFLALALSTDLKQRRMSFASRSGTFITFSLLIPLGSGIGILILNYLPSIFFIDVLAFGAAALLYLVTEELLVEAHETRDTPFITSSFFLGFLILVLLID